MPMRHVSLILAALAVSSTVLAQHGDFEAVEIRSEKLAENVHVLYGRGGTMGLLVGADGPVLIDDQFAPLSEKIRAAISRITPAPVRFVINTHWHPDHTGGNEAFGGTGSVIVAHENTRKRLSTHQVVEFFRMEQPPQPKEALPIVTFAESVSLHLNGEQLDAVHVPRAHTDTDVIIYFRNANLVHMGDVMQGPFYPFVDFESGGSLDGMIAAVGQVLERTDANTRFILGHAPVARRADVQAWREMLVTARKRIADALGAGKSQEEVVAAKPTREFDARYTGGSIAPDIFVQRAYVDLKRSRSQAR